MERVAHFLRIEFANGAPDFITLVIKEDEGWGELKIVNGSQFPSSVFLNINADDVDGFANAYIAV